MGNNLTSVNVGTEESVESMGLGTSHTCAVFVGGTLKVRKSGETNGIRYRRADRIKYSRTDRICYRLTDRIWYRRSDRIWCRRTARIRRQRTGLTKLGAGGLPELTTNRPNLGFDRMKEERLN